MEEETSPTGAEKQHTQLRSTLRCVLNIVAVETCIRSDAGPLDEQFTVFLDAAVLFCVCVLSDGCDTVCPMCWTNSPKHFAAAFVSLFHIVGRPLFLMVIHPSPWINSVSLQKQDKCQQWIFTEGGAQLLHKNVCRTYYMSAPLTLKPTSLTWHVKMSSPRWFKIYSTVAAHGIFETANQVKWKIQELFLPHYCVQHRYE